MVNQSVLTVDSTHENEDKKLHQKLVSSSALNVLIVEDSLVEQMRLKNDHLREWL